MHGELSVKEIDERRANVWGTYSPRNLEQASKVALRVSVSAFRGICMSLAHALTQDTLRQHLDAQSLNGLKAKKKELIKKVAVRLTKQLDQGKSCSGSGNTLLYAYEFEQYLKFRINKLANGIRKLDPQCSDDDTPSVFLPLLARQEQVREVETSSALRARKSPELFDQGRSPSGGSQASTSTAATASLGSDSSISGDGSSLVSAASRRSGTSPTSMQQHQLFTPRSATPSDSEVEAALPQMAPKQKPKLGISEQLKPFRAPLEAYREKRAANSRNYFVFGHWESSFSKAQKLSAVDKLIVALKTGIYPGSFLDYKEAIDGEDLETVFDQTDLMALHQGRLGKAVAQLDAMLGSDNRFMQKFKLDCYIASKMRELKQPKEKVVRMQRQYMAGAPMDTPGPGLFRCRANARFQGEAFAQAVALREIIHTQQASIDAVCKVDIVLSCLQINQSSKHVKDSFLYDLAKNIRAQIPLDHARSPTVSSSQ